MCMLYPGIAAYISQGVVIPQDKPPGVPENLRMDGDSATSLNIRWNHPVQDGGATLEKYRLHYSTNSSFDTYEYLDLPIIPEVQTVVVDNSVAVDTQAIRILTDVSNEQQVVQTTVNGVDEIQTITTYCDDVTNEIQRITTNAIDVDEVQTIELIGTDVNEVQLIQTSIVDLPEIQLVDISAPYVAAKQVVGLIITNINTDGS